VELPIWDETVCVRALLAGPQARLADLVPFARAVATRVALSVLRQLGQRDVDVPCSKGCAACCRYLIPLAPPEAFRLVEELQQLPPERRAGLVAAFAAAERTLHSVAPPALQDDLDGMPHAAEMARIGQWHDALALDCPLLEDELCSCYDWRPASCRGYVINSAADYCRPPLTFLGTRVCMPVSVTQALCKLTARLEDRPAQAVLLPVAPTWAAANWPRARRRWGAREMVELLARILRQQAIWAGRSHAA
jgi:Fe-S-cluster containining protein